MKSIKIKVELDNLKNIQNDINNLGKNNKLKLELDTANINNSLKNLSTSIDSVVNKLNKSLGKDAFNGMSNSANKAKKEIKDVESTLTKIEGKATKTKITVDAKGATTEVNTFGQAFGKTTTEVVKNGKVMRQSTSEDFSKMEKFINDYQVKLNSLSTKGVDVSKLQSQLNGFKADGLNASATAINKFKAEVNGLGTSTTQITSLGTAIQNSLGKIGIYVSSAMVIRQLWTAFKDGLNTIVELDTAMRDLKRVTDETEATYSSFMTKANQTAIALGSTTSGAIEATTTFSQLGYTFQEASEYMSEMAIILSNVGDMSASDAASSIVSILKGFRLEAQDTTTILDVLNEAGNRFAITTGDLTEGLRVGGASLATANNSLEQSSALIIAGTEVMRNSNIVAQGLKTISMRMRGVSEDGEELNASMGTFIKNITGVDLTDTNGEFRSTYDVLKDIGEVWDTLNSMEQASLAEEIAGKNRANVFTSIMQNASQLEEAYNTLSDSAGSAAKEQEAYMDSLAGKINALKESFTSISMNAIDSDMFKGLVDGATNAIQIIDGFIQKFGGIGTVVMIAVPLLTTFSKSFSTMTQGFTASIPVIGNWQSSLQKTVTTQQQRINLLKSNIETEKSSASTSKASAQAMGVYQKQLSGATAKMALAQAGTMALNMAMGMLVSAGIALAIAGLQKMWDYCTYTSQEFEELSSKASALNASLEEINNGTDVAGRYISLNKELQDANLSAERHAEITKEIDSLRDQLGQNPAYAIAINNENLSLEEQLALVEKISKIELNKQLKDLKESLPNAENLGTMSNELDMYTTKIDTLQGKLDKLAKGESVTDAFGKTIKSSDTDAINKLMSDLDDAKVSSQEVAQEILGIQEIINTLSENGVTLPIEIPDSILEKANEIVNTVEVLGSNVDDTGLKNLTVSAEEAQAEVESLNDSLQEISAPNWDLNTIVGDLDLSQVSNELVKVTEETNNARVSMEMYLGIFDEIGGQITNIESIVDAMKEAGGLTDEVKDKVIATGDAELIAMLDNKNVLQDLLTLKEKDIKLKEEARDKAIEEANALVEGQEKVLSQIEKEKTAQEELNALKEKYKSLSMTEDGKVVSSTGMDVNQFSKVIQGAEDTRKAIIDLDGQMSLVTFDKDGKLTGEFLKVKEVAEDTFAVIQQNASGDTMFAVTIDSNGNEIQNELQATTQAIDGTQIAVTELNGKEVTINFNKAGEIIGDVGEVVKRFDGLKESIIDINGTKFSMTIDSEGNIINPLEEVQTTIDGTIQKVEEVNGKKIVLTLDNGVFKQDVEATNNLVDDFKGNVDDLNGKSIEINIDGTDSLASNLREITQETEGVYTALATVNGQDVRIRVDEDGNLLELIENLGSVQEAVADTQYAFESIGGGWTITDADGVMTWIWNVHEGVDGLKVGIGELNDKPIRVEFDDSGNYKVEELQWNVEGLLETTKEIDGKTYTCTYDLNGNLIEQKEVVKEVNDLLDKTDGKDAEATANIDTSGAEEKAKIVNDELAKMDGKTASASVDVDTTSAEEKSKVINDQLAEMDNKTVSASVSVETNAAEMKARVINEQLAEMDGKTTTTNVQAETSEAETKLQQIQEDIKQTEQIANDFEGDKITPTADVSDVMRKLQLLRTNIQQTRSIASNPIRVTAKDNGISNVINLLGNLSSRISNLRNQASSPITITTTTVNKQVTQYSSTGTPNASKSSASRTSLPSIQSDSGVAVASAYGVASTETPLMDWNTPMPTFGDFEFTNEPMPSGYVAEATEGVATMASSYSRASSNISNAISSIGGNISDLNYYYKAIGSATSALKDYNQALQEVRDTSEDHTKWLDLEIDRYFRLNDAIEDYDNLLSYNAELQKSVEEGSSQYYKLQSEELYLYQKKIEALKSLQSEKEKEKNEIASILRQNGFVIDSYGNLLNSQELLANEMAKINAMSDNDTNKEYYIENIKTLSDYVNKYTSLMNGDIAGTREEILKLQNTIKNTATSTLEDLREKIVNALQAQREEEKEKELGILDDRIAELKKQLNELDDDYEDKKSKKAKLEAEIAKWSNDDSSYAKSQLKKLQEQLAELNKEILKDELNQQIEDIESQKDTIEEAYDKQLSEKELYYEADRLLAEKNMEEIQKLLEGYTDTFKDLGGLLGEEFKTNFVSQIEEAMKALDYLKGENDKYTNSTNTSTSNPTVSNPIPTPQPTPTPAPAEETKVVAKGSRVKISDIGSTIYKDSYTNKSSGTVRGAGVGANDTLYVVNDNNGRMAVSRTNNINDALFWIDKNKLKAFDIGGYTGDWGDKSGRMALLHSQEYVLTKEQTSAWIELVPKLTKLVEMPQLDNSILSNLPSGDINSNNTVSITNEWNIENNTEMDVLKTEKTMTQMLKSELRRFGKIK